MKQRLFFLLCWMFFTVFSFAEEQETITASKDTELTTPLLEDSLPTTDFSKTFIRMLISLAAIIILLLVTYWALKKMMRMKQIHANQQKNIKILEKRMLSPKTMLYLIEINGNKIFLSESHLEVRSHSFSEEKNIAPEKPKNTH